MSEYNPNPSELSPEDTVRQAAEYYQTMFGTNDTEQSGSISGLDVYDRAKEMFGQTAAQQALVEYRPTPAIEAAS